MCRSLSRAFTFQATAAAAPPATFQYFVPLPESDLYEHTYKPMGSGAVAGAPVMVSTVSLSVSTNGTIIVWDHWEDGYEPKPSLLNDTSTTTATAWQASTRVWGDGNASNGCAPSITTACADEADYLVAGDLISIQQNVSVPRDSTTIQIDGGDLITSTFPIGVTRSVYPHSAGPSMAAELEIYDTTFRWGTAFGEWAASANVMVTLHEQASCTASWPFTNTFGYRFK